MSDIVPDETNSITCQLYKGLTRHGQLVTRHFTLLTLAGDLFRLLGLFFVFVSLTVAVAPFLGLLAFFRAGLFLGFGFFV